jgi:Zn-dependent peptidase ImmA (M78 family)
MLKPSSFLIVSVRVNKLHQARLSLACGKAREIVREFYITDPSHIQLKEIAWLRGALVKESQLQGMQGRLLRRGDGGIITVRRDLPEPGQKRFVIAHELGHFELHHEVNQAFVCTDTAFLYWYQQQPPEESEANAFAAELLMPQDLFAPKVSAVPVSFNSIGNLADEFRTSLTATAVRYIDLTPHECALVVSENGAVRWFRRSPRFRFRVHPPATPVHQHSCAADLFANRPPTSEMEEVPALAWLGDEAVESSWRIGEDAVFLTSYGIVLSLIWVIPDSDLDKFERNESPVNDPDHFTPDGQRYRW